MFVLFGQVLIYFNKKIVLATLFPIEKFAHGDVVMRRPSINVFWFYIWNWLRS